MEDSSFAGLPSASAPAVPGFGSSNPYGGRKIPRHRWAFSIPKSEVNPDFFNSHSADDLGFEMAELTLDDQDHCAKNANGNASVLTRLLVFASVVKIGGKVVYQQYEPVENWYRELGRKADRLVQDAFTHLHSVPEGVTQTFLGGAKPVVD